jgi:hypothetical protein
MTMATVGKGWEEGGCPHDIGVEDRRLSCLGLGGMGAFFLWQGSWIRVKSSLSKEDGISKKAYFLYACMIHQSSHWFWHLYSMTVFHTVVVFIAEKIICAVDPR